MLRQFLLVVPFFTTPIRGSTARSETAR